MLIFLGTAFILALCIGGAVITDTRRRTRQEQADDLEAARLRLLDEGVDIHAIEASGPPQGTVYTSTAVMEAPLVVDPTVVEHVAPGVGSLTSFAVTADDTRMRTSAQLRELEAAEAAAYAEAPAHNDRLFFVDFEAGMEKALAEAGDAWALIDAWVARYHDGEHYANCVRCAEVHDVHSDEYALIVTDRESADTGVFSAAELDAMIEREKALSTF